MPLNNSKMSYDSDAESVSEFPVTTNIPQMMKRRLREGVEFFHFLKDRQAS